MGMIDNNAHEGNNQPAPRPGSREKNPASNDTKRRLAVVIGSGTLLCAASLGMWQAFEEEGIEISMAVGCSGGSFYAGVIALGYDLQTARELSFDMWTSDIFEGYGSNLHAALSGEMRFTEQSGLIDDRVAMERIRRLFGDLTFDQARIPLYIVSTDLYSGESVVHVSGRVDYAVRASIAIPLIFSPWQIEGQWLVDGAVSNPLPVDVAIKEGADIIAAMGFELPTRRRMRSYTAVAAHFNSLYMNNILKSRYAFYNAVHHAEIIPILPEFDHPLGTFDIDQIPYIIEAGAQAARKQVPYLHRLLSAQ
jgi:NTE family protein